MENKTDDNRYCYKYPHPAVTADCVILGFDGTELSVLLVERGNDPFKGCWAMPGGFVNIDESAEDGARRELQEETGLTSASMEQFHAYSEPDRDPRERIITIAFLALVRKQDVKGSDDAADARWFPLSAVPRLAFDHDRMLSDALRHLRDSLRLHPEGNSLLPRDLTADEHRALVNAIQSTENNQ